MTAKSKITGDALTIALGKNVSVTINFAGKDKGTIVLNDNATSGSLDYNPLKQSGKFSVGSLRACLRSLH